MLMSWIPAIIALIAAGVMTLYPLNQNKMDEIKWAADVVIIIYKRQNFLQL